MDFPVHARVRDYILLEIIGGSLSQVMKARPSPDRARMQLAAKGNEWVSFLYDGTVDSLLSIRIFYGCGVVLGALRPDGPPRIEEVDKRLDASLTAGLLSIFRSRSEPIRFRVSPLRFGRWEIRDHLVGRLGWINDPSNWDLNVASVGPYLVAQVGALHYSRRFPKTPRHPSSTNPVVAAFLVLVADPRPGEVVYDLFCGTGTILAEVLSTRRGVETIGSDLSARLVRSAATTLAAGERRLLVADASSLPLRAQAVDAVISNLPFGKRAGSHRSNRSLYPGFVRELERVLRAGGRAIMLTEEKRLLAETIQRHLRVSIREEHRLSVGGLHPSVFVVTRS